MQFNSQPEYFERVSCVDVILIPLAFAVSGDRYAVDASPICQGFPGERALDAQGNQSLTDVNTAMSYLAPGPPSPGPGPQLREIEPTEKWLHHLELAELIPGQETGSLITIGPTSELRSNFSARMSADGNIYGEYLVVAQEGDNWKAAVRVVDITHQLNLIHCHSPGLFIEPYRPLKNEGVCAGGYQTDISPWESWQKVEDNLGNSPY